jgi:hypothetical protein
MLDAPVTINLAALWAEQHGFQKPPRYAIRLAIASGQLKARQLANGSFSIEPDDLRHYLEQRAVERAQPSARGPRSRALAAV